MSAQAALKRMDKLVNKPCAIKTIILSDGSVGTYCDTHFDFMSWVVWSDERDKDLPKCMRVSP